MQGSCKYQTKPTWTFFVNPQVSRVRTEWPWCSSWEGSRTRKSPRWDFCPRWRMEAQSTSLPLQNSSMGQPGSNHWWKNWSLPRSRVCDSKCERICAHRHISCCSWHSSEGSSPGSSSWAVTLIPSALVVQLSVELPSRQAGLEGTNDQQWEREREIPAHGLTWQPSAGAAAMGLVLLFGKVLLFFLSV